jgi:hypothetical protein
MRYVSYIMYQYFFYDYSFLKKDGDRSNLALLKFKLQTYGVVTDENYIRLTNAE